MTAAIAIAEEQIKRTVRRSRPPLASMFVEPVPMGEPPSSRVIFPDEFGEGATYPTKGAAFRDMEIGDLWYLFVPHGVVVGGNRAYYNSIRGAAYHAIGSKAITFARVSAAFVSVLRLDG